MYGGRLGGGGNISEILRKYTMSIKALAKKVCPYNSLGVRKFKLSITHLGCVE